MEGENRASQAGVSVRHLRPHEFAQLQLLYCLESQCFRPSRKVEESKNPPELGRVRHSCTNGGAMLKVLGRRHAGKRKPPRALLDLSL